MFAFTAAGRKPAAASPMFVAALGLLMAFGPMAIDMYLPALPAIGRAFHATEDRVEWSLSTFFFGFGIGQIAWGALADRLGRRGPVAAGILLYLIGCVGCSMAGGIATLAVWRFVQALGACAGPVLARAMIRDVFTRERAASMLSLMMLVMGVAPLMAPIIGGYLLNLAGWRAIFWVQAAFGIVAILGLLSLPETLPPERRAAVSPIGLLKVYLQLLGNRRYLGYGLCSALIYGGLFAYLAGTPFVYIEYFKVRSENYAYLLGINIAGMIIVNTINSRIVLKLGPDRVLRLGCLLSAVFGLVLLGAAVAGIGGLVGIALPLFLVLAMTGMVGANAMAGGMSVFPQAAGSASALTGMLQFASGALSGEAVGLLSDGTPVPMAAVIAALVVLGLVLNLVLTRSR